MATTKRNPHPRPVRKSPASVSSALGKAAAKPASQGAARARKAETKARNPEAVRYINGSGEDITHRISGGKRIGDLTKVAGLLKGATPLLD